MRVASINWKIKEIRSEDEFWGHFHALVDKALNQGSDAIVLPENFTYELLHLHPHLPESEVAECMESYGLRYKQAIQEVGQRCIILGGSTILDGQNVGRMAGPEGRGWYGKHLLTQYEIQPLGLKASAWFHHLAEVGGVICYDSEFPEAARALAESGVRVIGIPAYTETVHGFHRVRWGAHARATELQVFVLHASLVGSLGREPIVSAVGSSAIITPSHAPFPESAILAETTMNEEGVAIADISLEDLEQCRHEGDVRNWHDRNRARWDPVLAERPLDQA